jgi:hypothetical protein
MNKYLRHKTKGTIYGWSENMAKSQNVEEVTEEQAYPDRFAPKIAKGRKAKVSLMTDDIPEPPQDDPMADLNEELTRKTQV